MFRIASALKNTRYFETGTQMDAGLHDKCPLQLFDFNQNWNILWCVQPLLCNDREMGGCTRPVSGQRLSKHVPIVTNQRSTMEVLLETGCFCVVSAEML
jgi:hypothetical protein